VITVHPIGAGYNPDDPATALTVTAGVTDGGTLSYQWYGNDTNTNIGGTAVTAGTGGTTASYTPPTTTVSAVYYYVVVTNTNAAVNGATAAQAVSKAARINVTSGPITDAETPSITVQPASAAYDITDTATALTVTAGVTDGGELSYRWFRNTTNSATGGSPIAGATEASYTPPTTAAGTFYYYVVVTNTNEAVSGRPDAETASSVATITVTDPAIIAGKAQLQSAIDTATTAKTAATPVGPTWTEGTLYAAGATFTGTAAAALPAGLYHLASGAVTAYDAAITAAQTAHDAPGATAASLAAAKATLEAAGVTFAAAKTPGTLRLPDRVAAAGTGIIVYLYADENLITASYPPITKTLTLKGVGAERTVQLVGTYGATMFSLNSSNANLTLDEKVTLKGTAENWSPLVSIDNGGTFTMKGDARITGNTAGSGGVHVTGSGSRFTMEDTASVDGNTGSSGGGVFVSNNAEFIMRGDATVSGNNGGVYNGSGGGVYVLGGSFTMEGSAKVSGNTALNGGGVWVSTNHTGGTTYNGTFIMKDNATVNDNISSNDDALNGGGGVHVTNGATFTMEGGATVSDNTSAANGGGVYVFAGTFTMEGSAVISGNSASLKGGGVFLFNFNNDDYICTFIKTGGTIYGDANATPGDGNATDNTSLAGDGHAVCAYAASGQNPKSRTATAGTGDKLYARYAGTGTGTGFGSWTYDGTSVTGIEENTTANWQ
jgi:hypothetical protein